MSVADRGLLPVDLIPAFVEWATSTLKWQPTPERHHIRQSNHYERDALRDTKGKLHILYVRDGAQHASVAPATANTVRRFLKARRAE